MGEVNVEEFMRLLEMQQRRPYRGRELLVGPQVYSRKVFVGDLPCDLNAEEITAIFVMFGPLTVDWPNRCQNAPLFPPNRIAYLLFRDPDSAQKLVQACDSRDGKLYRTVVSEYTGPASVEIRPWRLADMEFMLEALPLYPRKTVFVGGLPRLTTAHQLADFMEQKYGGVSYASIATDSVYNFPKEIGRVTFTAQESLNEALNEQFVMFCQADVKKTVEIKPFIFKNQQCDQCNGVKCGGGVAEFFCSHVACLLYYCPYCWRHIHLPRRRHDPFKIECNKINIYPGFTKTRL